jgi:hypothetical protein
VLVSVIVLIGVSALLANPLRWPEFVLHSWLLKRVPIGSNFETLQGVAQKNGWRLNATWQGHKPNSGWGGVDGDTVAWLYLGGYRSLFRVDIDSFWTFDDHGKLMDVKTRRTVDAP